MIERLRANPLVPWIGGALAFLITCVYVFSPQASAFGAGMTAGQLAVEILPAMYVGITALSLVLIYRTVRIINFAQVAFGVVGTQLFYEFYSRDIFPYALAWPVGILGGTLITLIVGIIASTLFFNHPRLTMTVVTVFLTSIVQFASEEITAAFQKPGEQARVIPVPKEGSWEAGELFTLGVFPFRVAHLIGLIAVTGCLVGIAIFFRKTRFGIAIRASAENSDRASLLGINVKLVNVVVWVMVGLVTTVAALAKMPVGYAPGGQEAFSGLLAPMTAAIIGRFTNMPVAFGVGMLIHLLRASLLLDTSDSSLIDILLFLVVMVGLLFQKQKYTRLDGATSWKAVREFRPTPVQLLAIPAIKQTRRLLILFGALLVLGLPQVISAETTRALAQTWPFAILLSSLVVLTGWTGQISLGHTALMGAGSLLAAHASSQWGVPFLLTLPIGGLAGAALATAIGIPALRIRGLFLAVATFAMGVVFPTLFFNERFLASWLPTEMGDAGLFGFTLTDAKFAYYLLLAIFIVIAMAIRTLRNSRAGRMLIAIRDNEQGVQALGVNVVRTRLMAFAISGFIAGIAGSLVVHQMRGLDPGVFSADAGFFAFQLIIIGGVSTLSGAILGACLLSIGGTVIPGLLPLLSSVGGLFLLMAIPGGLAQIVFGMRDGVLRVVALRRHIVVPSLFADYSPEAWEKRLTPLAPAVPSQGLGALPADQRYALESRLYGKVTV